MLLEFLCNGLLDALSPCAGTTIAFLIFFILSSSLEQKDLTVAVSLFIGFLIISNIFFQSGLFENLRQIEFYWLSTRILYLFIAAICIIVGALNFYDWVNLRFLNSQKKYFFTFPALQRSDSILEKNKSIVFTGRSGFFAVAVLGLSGFFFAVIQPTCCGLLSMATVFQIMNKQGRVFQAWMALGIYSLAMMLPLALFAWAVLRLRRRNLGEQSSPRTVALAKVALAALFFALGYGLFNLFL